MKSAQKVPPTNPRKPVPVIVPPSKLLHKDAIPPRGSVTNGRNLNDGFRELEREGIFCQYAIRNQLLRNNHRTEKDTRGILDLYKRHGGSDRYQMTLDRVFPTGRPNVEDIGGIHPPFPELSERWIEEFAAEVVQFLERISEGATDEIPVKLRALILALDTCDPLNLDIMGRNSETIRLMREHKENLLQRLGVIAEEWPIDPPSNEQGQRLTWKGQPAELFALFEELVGKGWIELPKTRGKRSRDKLARTVHTVFAFTSGTTLQVGTAVNYLKKGRNGVNEQRPEARVIFALKRNPDVGTDYDPDKAGE